MTAEIREKLIEEAMEARKDSFSQFASLDSFRVIAAIDQSQWEEFSLGELLPKAFQKHHLTEGE